MKEKKKRVTSVGSFFKRYYKYIFLALGIAGIVLLVIANDPANIDWHLFTEARFFVILAECFGVWLLIYALHTLTYYIILKKDGRKIDIWHMFKITFTGFALNNVTPAGLVGGEPYRIMELKKYVSTEKAASATFSFTIVYAAGHLLLWDAGLITYLCFGMPGDTFIDILLLVTGGFNLIATFFLLFLRVNMVYPIMRFLTKLPGIGKKIAPMVEKKKEKYIEIDRRINVFRKNWFRFGIVLLIQFASRLLEALEYFLIIRFFLNGLTPLDGKPFNYFQGLMVMSTCSLIGNLLFLIPMQAGSREGGMQLVLAFLFDDVVKGKIATPTFLVYRFREFMCTLIGIIMVAGTRRNKRAIAEAEKSEAERALELEKAEQEAKANSEVTDEQKPAEENSVKEIKEENVEASKDENGVDNESNGENPQ